jgi:hypothetical protein
VRNLSGLLLLLLIIVIKFTMDLSSTRGVRMDTRQSYLVKSTALTGTSLRGESRSFIVKAAIFGFIRNLCRLVIGIIVLSGCSMTDIGWRWRMLAPMSHLMAKE